VVERLEESVVARVGLSLLIRKGLVCWLPFVRSDDMLRFDDERRSFPLLDLIKQRSTRGLEASRYILFRF
jgi:hypothetical protein